MDKGKSIKTYRVEHKNKDETWSTCGTYRTTKTREAQEDDFRFVKVDETPIQPEEV